MNDTDRSIATLYDTLLGSEPGKVATAGYAVHKRLRFPSEWHAQGILDSNDWLRQNLKLGSADRILDAGCGVGGTLFALLGEERSGVGLTLSGQQIALARAEADRRGLGDRLRFLQQSYDEPAGDQFDLIISVEALVHSQHLGETLRGLRNQLAPGGQLVILEDMATQDLRDQPQARMLRQSWHLPSLPQHQTYRTCFDELGLKIVEEIDFTDYVHRRSWPGWLVSSAWRLVSKRSSTAIYVGGLAQELLYQKGLLTYRLIRARS